MAAEILPIFLREIKADSPTRFFLAGHAQIVNFRISGSICGPLIFK
jgi:hypothetical protein